MTDEHDPTTALPTDRIDDLETIDTATAVLSGDLRGTASLLGGGLLLLSALRSLGRGQLRALPKGAAGAFLLDYGLRTRRSSEASTLVPGVDDIEEKTEATELADEAWSVAERLGGTDDDRGEGLDSVREEASGSRIEFTDDAADAEPRSKPDDEGDAGDPRRDTDRDGTEIDLSDTATADEPGEATGPDPEQAEPTQTDATEPEETPDEDASHETVDRDEDDEPSTTDARDADPEDEDTDATGDDESGDRS